MFAIRPTFGKAWNRFSEVNVDVGSVGSLIGGKVQVNISSGIFENACSIRMSYVLNYTGVSIPSDNRYATVTGEDKKRYMYRVNDMMVFLRSKFGEPDLSISMPIQEAFFGLQGIIVFEGSGWRNARGHITLWNGMICSDYCYFIGGSNNGQFVPDNASLWILK